MSVCLSFRMSVFVYSSVFLSNLCLSSVYVLSVFCISYVRQFTVFCLSSRRLLSVFCLSPPESWNPCWSSRYAVLNYSYTTVISSRVHDDLSGLVWSERKPRKTALWGRKDGGLGSVGLEIHDLEIPEYTGVNAIWSDRTCGVGWCVTSGVGTSTSNTPALRNAFFDLLIDAVQMELPARCQTTDPRSVMWETTHKGRRKEARRRNTYT